MSALETGPMLSVAWGPYRLTIRESLGLAHEEQVIEVPIPAAAAGRFFLREEETGRLYSVQASSRNPGYGYLRLAIDPGQTLVLIETDQVEDEIEGLTIAERDGNWLLQNRHLGLELVAGAKEFKPGDTRGPVTGPVIRMRQSNGPWRGRTFFDTQLAPIRQHAGWLERGPLRLVYHYQIEFPEGRFYNLVLTADGGADFVRMEETFSGAAFDQLVWDFSGDDLPEALSLLDSTAGAALKWIHYHFDQRHARLWCWSQFSQLHDLSDGFALQFPGADDVVAVVALEGGKWRGNALNHLEGWTRRWKTGDPSTRRLPAEAKADSFPGPERIPARGDSVQTPHFSLEGWLRRGSRIFGLLFSTREKIAPAESSPSAQGEKGGSPALGHFEEVPDRCRYRAQQGRLRRIQIQHGLMPLQEQLAMTFAWPVEAHFEMGKASSLEERRILGLAERHLASSITDGDPEGVQSLGRYLEARIFGFWEGSGSAYSNCVVGRKIGPGMLRLEFLARQGKIAHDIVLQWRAWFAFLAYLNASQSFYPGAATMEPIGAPDATEPTLAGMANQNFYTDALAVPGYAAEVFPAHPQAAFWRGHFIGQWQRQLAFHMYPESGLWEESHTYFQHVLATVLPLLLRRREAGADDPFADPNLQKLVVSALAQLTPRDAVLGGVRHLVAFGDHGVDVLTYRHLYLEYARAFAPHAPALARQLAWMGREMGDETPSGITPLAPDWKHGRIEGLGFFFRGRDAEGRENLLALRSGTSWGHHHNDEGSFQFFAHGRALIVDAAFSRPQERGERKIVAAGHTKAALEEIEPLHHLWRFNRGWILDARSEDDLAYAVAGVPVYSTRPKNLEAQLLPHACWELRAVVELAPAVYLVADYLEPHYRHRVRFQVAHQEVERKGSSVFCSFAGACHLRIVPFGLLAPPGCSLDRPLPAIPLESTTAVEYGEVTGPWSLFVVAAFPSPEDRLEVTRDAVQIQLGGMKRKFAITLHPDQRLRILREGSESTVCLDPAPLLAVLRTGRV